MEAYGTRLLTPETWDDFSRLVEENNGVWGGCWCIGFHVEGLASPPSRERNRAAKHAHVEAGTVHQMLVYEGDRAVGWSQFGPPVELPNVQNRRSYERDLEELPAWRMGCIFTGARHRGAGVARTAVGAVLDAIRDAGGGTVEAYPEQSDGRPPQRGAYFHTGPEALYAGFGFTRVRRIAKWRWVMRLDLAG